ncbi:hypothetical protein PCANC_00247 [Puccinia coronata f. sp. avenae]|uniref:Uncharacterized protein n=1 Tax=Puccinia coronata f. sp. avenae TaxID=200324 RepID=A0A2N5W8Z9_9BASI|nr:hypothetical protein PCASD_06119 [Puccinia coronata f. sp. avenae]PLW58714.1 hypothetical protein PCANC_00247 [Puccinia coronata f. sp. avenae]
MITFTIFGVLLVLAIVLEAQGFPCTDKVFKNGVCGKGKNANKTFKRAVLASENGRDPQNNRIFQCNPTPGEVEAQYCCPSTLIGAADLPKCKRS